MTNKFEDKRKIGDACIWNIRGEKEAENNDLII